MKTIGKCGAACLLELKSCVVLMRKLALFVGNLCMICMLWKFLVFNPPVIFLIFLWKWVNLFGIFSTCEKLRAFERNPSLWSSYLIPWTSIVLLWWPCWKIFSEIFLLQIWQKIEHNANFKQWFNVFLVISEASQGYESKAYGVLNHNLKLQSPKVNRTRDICNFPTQGWGDTAFCTRNWSETYIFWDEVEKMNFLLLCLDRYLFNIGSVWLVAIDTYSEVVKKLYFLLLLLGV